MEKGVQLGELERFAISGHSKSVLESSGLCFQATLMLAREARRLGIHERAAFVRWHVSRDVNFLEHWALVLDNGRVLDMTAVQVDGNPNPLRQLDGYPANYVRPRCYPTDLVLGLMERQVPPSGWHYSRDQIWALHRHLFRHDAAKALRERSVRDLFGAAMELARRAVTLCMGYLLERAIGRMSRILTRMR